MSIKPWELVSRQYEIFFNMFTIRADRSISPRTGVEYDFYVLESKSIVTIIPITPDDEVILIKQFRHGIEGITLEIPGGLIDNDDTPMMAAKRELFEETGYKTSEMIELGYAYTNPAIQNNRCYTFIAKDVFLAGGPQLDDQEDIEVVKKPVSMIPSLISNGEINHSLVISAFYRYFMEYSPNHFTDNR